MSAHMFYTQVVPVSASPILISDGPFNYADNLWCRWVRSTHPHIHARIQARARARMHGKKVLDGSTAESIAISFTSLMTEAGYDFVRIYRGTQARACVRARAHVRARVHACVRGRSVRGVPFCSWRRACTAWTAWSSCTPRELYHTSYYLLVIADQL